MRFCRDVPVFVEVGEAGIAVECYASSAFVFNSLGDVLGLMSCKRSSENGQVLVGFQSDGSLWLPPSCRRRASATPSRHFAIGSRCDKRGARSPSCSLSTLSP